MSDVPGRGATAPLGEGAAKADAGAGGPAPPMTTLPLAAPAAHPRAATQMSASAVPSTLESPTDPGVGRADADARGGRLGETALPATLDEVNGSTMRDDAARDAAIREAANLAGGATFGSPGPVGHGNPQGSAMHGAPSGEPSVRRHGPATMMSPTPGASGGSSPPGPLAAEDAVVDAVLPAAAFARAGGSGGAFGMGNAAQAPYPAGAGGPHAQWGAPGAHAGAFEAREPRHAAPAGYAGQGGSFPPPGLDARGAAARRSNTTLIILLVVGAVVLLGGVVVIAGGAIFLSARKSAATRTAKASEGASAADSPGANPSPAPGAATAAGTATAAPTTAGTGDPAPRAQPRASDNAARVMGGTKARLSGLTAGSLELEGVRTSINAVMPRIDACFAANELEPPNHETAAYDLEVAASGTVTRADASTQTGRTAKLDTCVGTALRGARMAKSQGGSRVKAIFSARISGAQQNAR